MPRSDLFVVTAVASAIVVMASVNRADAANDHADDIVVRFEESRNPIDNPERGFSAPVGLRGGDLARMRVEKDVSLVRIDGRLDQWRDSDLPADYLAALDARLDEARAAGVKVILRFMYNEGPFPNSEPDASLDRILSHIAQLKPSLQRRGDVIAWMEAGFIGAWGEWHSSTHGLDKDDNAKRAVVAALADALPAPRAILLRYPVDIAALFGASFTAQDAANGRPKSRIGHHNDCFLASDTDTGTYERRGRSIAQEKAMIAAYGRFAPIGGETCAVNPPRSECPAALAELAQLGFSELNRGYHPGVLDGWRQGGCYDVIRARLGYRLWVDEARLPRVLTAGRDAVISLRVRNSGFASVHGVRAVYLVLDGPVQRRFRLPVDPRTWTAGSAHEINLVAQLPPDLPTGKYSVAVWLPDAAATLRDDPRYAIQLANDGAWDANSGLNRLVAGVVVRKPKPAALKPAPDPPMALGARR